MRLELRARARHLHWPRFAYCSRELIHHFFHALRGIAFAPATAVYRRIVLDEVLPINLGRPQCGGISPS